MQKTEKHCKNQCFCYHKTTKISPKTGPKIQKSASGPGQLRNRKKRCCKPKNWGQKVEQHGGFSLFACRFWTGAFTNRCLPYCFLQCFLKASVTTYQKQEVLAEKCPPPGKPVTFYECHPEDHAPAPSVRTDFYYYDDDYYYYYYYYYYCHLSSIYHQFVLLLWVSLDPSHNWEDWLCHWGLTLPRMSCSAWGGDSTWPALDQHVDIWSKNLWIPLKCPTFLYISPVWIPGFSFQWLFLWQTEEWSVWWDLDREDQAASWISRYVQVKMMDLSSRHVHHTMWFSPYFDF